MWKNSVKQRKISVKIAIKQKKFLDKQIYRPYNEKVHDYMRAFCAHKRMDYAEKCIDEQPRVRTHVMKSQLLLIQAVTKNQEVKKCQHLIS